MQNGILGKRNSNVRRKGWNGSEDVHREGRQDWPAYGKERGEGASTSPGPQTVKDGIDFQPTGFILFH